MKTDCFLGKFCELHKTTSTQKQKLQCICRYIFEIEVCSANKRGSKIPKRLRKMVTSDFETARNTANNSNVTYFDVQILQVIFPKKEKSDLPKRQNQKQNLRNII